MSNNLVIFGAGGFGRETALMIEQINRSDESWNLLGFFDDNVSSDSISGYKVLGGMDDLLKVEERIGVVIAVADPATRFTLRLRMRNSRLHFPALIHPTANTGSRLNKIGDGSIICASVIMTTNVEITEFVIINLACTIGHDVMLGEYSSVMPATSISGSVSVGPQTYIGTGVKILPGVTIGKGAQIGAGSVVTKHVLNNQTVVGVPARPVK